MCRPMPRELVREPSQSAALQNATQFQKVSLLSGGRSDPAFMAPGSGTFVPEMLPVASGPFAAVIWGSAGASRLSNHSSQGLRPLNSRYSLTVSMSDGNVCP